MDPLSVTASIITLLGASEGIVKGVSTLLVLHNAPAEVSELLDEVNDLRAVLSQVASLGNRLPEEPFHGPVISLKNHLNRANEQLHEIDHLMNTKLIKICEDQNPRPSRRAWLRLRDRLRSAQRDLQNTRINIGTLLSVIAS